MIRAVLDTNLLISSTLSAHGKPAKILDSWRENKFELVTSPKIQIVNGDTFLKILEHL